MSYLTNEKIIEEIVDKDYFCQFDFQLNDIKIKLYQLFEHNKKKIICSVMYDENDKIHLEQLHSHFLPISLGGTPVVVR